MSTIALWVLVLFETGLLLLLLRVLGELRQKGVLSSVRNSLPSETWGLNVGEQAPSFTATDFDGNVVHLEDFEGHRRILAFILPGCSSCADAIRVLNTTLHTENGMKVMVIGGPVGDLNHAYATEHNAQMPILTPVPDFDRELYRIRGVPFVFVLDEMGVIRAKGIMHEVEQLQHLLAQAFASVQVSG